MKAIVRRAFGGPEQLEIQDVLMPIPDQDQILVRVKAFGINRAEQYFRLGAWGDVHAISGIECVGEIEHDGSGNLSKGQCVIALMGGMGRSIAGSYAEYVCVPKQNVVPIQSSLGWAELAAIPESYATAWACLMDNLQLQRAQTLVIRGATSALGQAAMNIARHAGLRVAVTVRNDNRIDDLHALGAHMVLNENDNLSKQLRIQFPSGVDAVLDLIGTSTLLDSLKMLGCRGRVCVAGFLGGAEPIPDFNPLAHLPSGRQLSFFGSAFVFGTQDYPLADIPFQQIIDDAESGVYQAKPRHIFQFDEIQAAHRLLDDHAAYGKIVVLVS